MKKLFAIVLSAILLLSMAITAFAAEEKATAEEIAAILTTAKLTGGTFHANGITAPSDAYLKQDGGLVIEAGTKKGGNLHLYADIGALSGVLTDYTIEVKLAGVRVDNNWHYGFGINNQADNAMATYFTVRSGAYTEGQNYGALMCYFKSAGGTAVFNTDKLGAPDTAYSDMSAAVGSPNVLSVTYNSTDKTMTYKVNGVTIKTLTNDKADMTLDDVSLVVPHGTPEAPEIAEYFYLKIMDASGKEVYYNDFTGKSQEQTGTPNHKVTVSYVYENGDKAADDAVEEIAEGAYYNVTSAPIEGYRAENATGQMGQEDVNVTITYKKLYKVTVHYVKSDGSSAMDDYVIDNLVTGDSYSADSLPMANYTCDKSVVSGTIEGKDEEITVTYSPVKLTLTIHYSFADGSKAADDYVGEVEYGSGYSVDSPAIEGYTADKTKVSADNMKKKAEITVTYTANPVETTGQEGTTTSTEPSSETATGGCSSVIGFVTVLPIIACGAWLSLRKKENV